MSEFAKHWLTPAETSPVTGQTVDEIYRDIRLGQFPWEYVRCGKRIKISAKSLGLIGEKNPQNSKAPNQKEIEPLY